MWFVSKLHTLDGVGARKGGTYTSRKGEGERERDCVCFPSGTVGPAAGVLIRKNERGLAEEG